MRRVYMSFLGTSPYFECNYLQDGFEKISGVRFVQEATIRWYCSTWHKKDSIVIFTTDEAFNSNWKDTEDRDGRFVSGLSSCLHQADLPVVPRNVNIPSGKNTGEIWQIFDTVFKELQHGDNVYLDITHAFRSLPLLSLVILNYAKVIKKIKIEAISYGAMEAIGTARQVREFDPEQRNIPVFDLTAFDQLLDWSIAVDRYTGTGDASKVSSLAEMEIRPVLAATRGRDQDAQAVKLLAKNMKELSDAIATCRARTIPLAARRLISSFMAAREQEHIKPLSPLFDKLEPQINRFSGDEINDGLAAVRWCIDHSLVQQGITIFLETMVSYVITEALAGDMHDKDFRQLVNQAVKIRTENTPNDKWMEPAVSNTDVIRKIVKWFDQHEGVAKCFSNFIEPRNDINHAGQKDNPMSPDGFRKKLEAEVVRFRSAAAM